MSDVGRIRRTRRASTQAAPTPAIGAARQRSIPNFTMDVGRPPELGNENDNAFSGMNVSDLVDLAGGNFANSPAVVNDEDPFYRNLLSDDGNGVAVADATRIVTWLDDQLERDKESRKAADKIVARGIEETGYDRQNDVRTSPFPGASAVVHPLFAQAQIDFASRAMKQLFPAKGPVKTEIQGQNDEDDMKRAEKVRRFMNWMLTQRCRSYRAETDKMLHMLPFSGDALKKLYWDQSEEGFGRPKPEFVQPDMFIAPYATTDLETCPRYAHDLELWPERVAELMDNETWRKVQIQRTHRRQKSQQQDKSNRVTGIDDSVDVNDDVMVFREAHVDWYFQQLKQENDGYRANATKKPDAPQQTQPVQSQPGAQEPQMGAAPPGGDPEMVDLGPALEQARAQPAGAGMAPAQQRPETDIDAVKSSELKPDQKAPDDPLRVDRPLHGGFPGGPKLPYIITYHQETLEVVSIRRNWKKSDANQKKRVWFAHYVMFPWRSWNGIGLWHLIGGLAKSATGTLRALMDSAVIDNMPGGVRLANSRMSGDDISYRPMEFAKIMAPGIDDIRKVMMQYPKNPTSPVLFELLKTIVQWGSNFATTATQELLDAGPNTPATSLLQIIEHAGAVYSAIHARLHAAQEREFELLAELIAENLPDEGFAFSDEQGEETVVPADFDRVKIRPVSDPDTFSELQRSMKGQAMLDLAKVAREQGVNVDIRYAFCFYAQTLGLPEVDKLFPEQDKAVPRDPVSELFALMKGQPVDAFPGQNHKAHVAFLKLTAVNPVYQPMLAPVAAPFLALAQAHMMFMMRDEIEQAAGGGLPLNQPLPPEQQTQVAQMCAEIMAQMTQEVLENGPDPLIAMAQQLAGGAQGQAGAGGQNSDTPSMKLLAQNEVVKTRIAHDKMVADDQQKDNEHVRKMAEKQADLDSKERLAMFQEEMDDRRHRREVAAKLTESFAKMDFERTMSVEERAHAITQSVNKMIHDIFNNASKSAADAAKQTREMKHDVQLAALDQRHEHDIAQREEQNDQRDREHEQLESSFDRQHEGIQADKDRQHEARQADKAAAAAKSAVKSRSPAGSGKGSGTGKPRSK